ncbi:hypothetical protein HDU93_001733, partial [Gonapodya sp. JEL0774]
MPKIDGSKDSNKPRITIIPFVSRFIDGPANPSKNEYPIDTELHLKAVQWKYAMMGILLEHHVIYRREGLKDIPEAMQHTKSEYLGVNDHSAFLDEFIQDCLIKGGGGIVTEDLIARYRVWEKENGIRHPDSDKERIILTHFDKLLMDENQLVDIESGAKRGNVRRFVDSDKRRRQGYSGWGWKVGLPGVQEKGRGARSVTSLTKENITNAEWVMDSQTYVHAAVKERDWMSNASASILAGVVAEAQVKYHLCNGVKYDWRQLTLQNTEVAAVTSADILSLFTNQECSIAAAVKLIKKLTHDAYWEAPTTNFRMVTANHGVVTGRVDFHARHGRVMYILETKFSK